MKLEKGKRVYIGRHVFKDEIPEKFMTDELRKALEKQEVKPEKKKDKDKDK